MDPETPTQPGVPPTPLTSVPAGPPWVHSTCGIRQIDRLHTTVAALLLGGGTIFFGWRALLAVTTTVLCAASVYIPIRAATRALRPSRSHESLEYVLATAAMAGLCLPLTYGIATPIAAGVLAGLACHVVGRSRPMRIHPVAVVVVLVWLLPSLGVYPDGVNRWLGPVEPVSAVLRPGYAVIGDVYNTAENPGNRPWLRAYPAIPSHAVEHTSPAELTLRLRERMVTRAPLMADLLTSGRLPPMTHVLIGATPGPIGGTSQAALVLLGMYLMCRRLSSWPCVLAALIVATATLLLMPLQYDGEWTVVVERYPTVGWATSVTYVGYMLLATNLLLVVAVLSPATEPMGPTCRAVYGALLGSTAMISLWVLGHPAGAFLGLVLAGALSRPLDALHRSPLSHRAKRGPAVKPA